MWLLLVLIALGFAALRAAWPAPRRWSAADPLRLAAAPAIGFGIGGSVFFAFRIVLQQSPGAVIAVVCAITVALAAEAWRRSETAAPDAPAAAGDAPIWLWILGGAAAAMALVTYLMLASAAPHGEWDAWSIWNLRARFFFRAQEFVSPFSNSIEWAHPDYPLLVPGVIALLWHAAGSETPAIPATVAFFFLLSAVAVPFYVVRLLRGPALAILSALAILAATTLVRVSASQYADVPLAAFFVLAGSLLVYGLEVESAGAGPILLAGLAAGFAAWTKNEGLLFCGSLAAAHLFCVASRNELGRRVRTLVPLLAGMLVVLALVGHFKMRIAPANDLVNASNMGGFGAKMSDFNRYWMTFWAFVGEFLTFGNVLVPPVIVLSVWLALVRFREKLTGAQLVPQVAVALQLAGYFAIYVATTKDLDWQLNTSLPRLLLQVWPLAITGIFLISGDIFADRPQPSPAGMRSK